MQDRVGIWVSYKRALIVRVRDGDVRSVTEVPGDVDPKHRATGGFRSSRPFWHRSVVSAGREDARRDHEIVDFFGRVVASVGDASKIFMCGPGEAKQGLHSRFEIQPVAGRELLDPESTEGHLTDNQIVAHIRHRFGIDAPRSVIPRTGGVGLDRSITRFASP